MASNDTRVLNRRGARELSAQELERIQGRDGSLLTLLSVIRTHTASGASDTQLDEYTGDLSVSLTE